MHGCPVAGTVHTRMAASASATPRQLDTMSSLRELCPRLGSTTPGTRCSNNATSVQRKVILVTRAKRIVNFDRIICLIFLVCEATSAASPKYFFAQNRNPSFSVAVGRRKFVHATLRFQESVMRAPFLPVSERTAGVALIIFIFTGAATARGQQPPAPSAAELSKKETVSSAMLRQLQFQE